MKVWKHNKCKDSIRLNPKCWYNGNLVAKLRNKKVKRLWFERIIKPQANGGRNGLPLTDNAEGEEIV